MLVHCPEHWHNSVHSNALFGIYNFLCTLLHSHILLVLGIPIMLRVMLSKTVAFRFRWMVSTPKQGSRESCFLFRHWYHFDTWSTYLKICWAKASYVGGMFSIDRLSRLKRIFLASFTFLALQVFEYSDTTNTSINSKSFSSISFRDDTVESFINNGVTSSYIFNCFNCF